MDAKASSKNRRVSDNLLDKNVLAHTLERTIFAGNERAVKHSWWNITKLSLVTELHAESVCSVNSQYGPGHSLMKTGGKEVFYTAVP